MEHAQRTVVTGEHRGEATMGAAIAYLLFLPLVTCAVTVILLLLSALKPSKAGTSGVLPLPPSPPAVPVAGPLLCLVRARNRLEPAIRELHRRHGPVLTLRFLSPRPAIFVSGRGVAHRALVQRGPAFASRPPAIAPFRVLNSGQSTVSSAPYGPLWRSLRRNLTSGILHPSRVPLFAPARRWTLAALVSDLGRRSKEDGGEVTVVECLQLAMFSLLTYMCFGRRLHGRRVSEIEAVQRELFASYISFQVFAFCPAVTKRVFWRRWKKVLSIRWRQEELFLPLIRARRDRGGSMPDNGGEHDESLSYCYVDTLLAHQLPKEEGERALTDAEMVNLCTEFLTASPDQATTRTRSIPPLVFIIPHVSVRPPFLTSHSSPPNPHSPSHRTLLTNRPQEKRGEKSRRGDYAAMAGDPPTAAEKEALVSSFLEIAAGQTPDTATQFLQLLGDSIGPALLGVIPGVSIPQMTSWHLEEALQLFYIDGESALASHPAAPSAAAAAASAAAAAEVEEALRFAPPPAAALGDPMLHGLGVGEDDDVRAPLPVKRETLYGDGPVSVLRPNTTVAFRNFEQEARQSAVWDSAPNATSSSHDNLASLYRPPFSLMFNGPFDKAKLEASSLDKWLLINLQSTEEFSSHMVYHDASEGRKVCTYYNLVSIPAVLLIDPITGQKMRGWNGMVHPDRLLEDLLPYLDKGPKEHHAAQPQKRPRKVDQETPMGKQGKTTVEDEDEELARAVAASLEDNKEVAEGSDATDDMAEAEPEEENETSLNIKLDYPPLPEEPTGSRDLLCRVAIRLPNNRRIQRNFLHTDPIKLLWSFCATQVEDGEKRAFHFVQPIPGASKNLEFASGLTFKEAGLANSMINLSWD
ncbi:plant UBX domain-containing protein 7 [Panicum miliaceum]|uniref:Plant UBX domain-containing protein 7 n=1 Tax=Panicum miliaceum TaxID=4540 RepID=A0A3L6PVR7_PANMI|nr:plant UBX domain-containing protein 7 [Panicum miliaceum]